MSQTAHNGGDCGWLEAFNRQRTDAQSEARASLSPSSATPARSSRPGSGTGQNPRGLPEPRIKSLQARPRNFLRENETLRLRLLVLCDAELAVQRILRRNREAGRRLTASHSI